MRRRFVVTALLLALSALAGCSIPVDDSPRDIAISRASNNLESSTTTGGDTTAYVYFLKGGHIVSVSREVATRSLSTVLDHLFAGPALSEKSSNIVTQIPSTATVESVRSINGTVEVAVSKQLGEIIGQGSLQAFAQLVFTVTDILPSATVEFTVGGQLVKVSSPERGDVTRVTECDFARLLPSDNDLAAARLSSDAAKHLAARRKALQSRCPEAD